LTFTKQKETKIVIDVKNLHQSLFKLKRHTGEHKLLVQSHCFFSMYHTVNDCKTNPDLAHVLRVSFQAFPEIVEW